MQRRPPWAQPPKTPPLSSREEAAFKALEELAAVCESASNASYPETWLSSKEWHSAIDAANDALAAYLSKNGEPTHD